MRRGKLGEEAASKPTVTPGDMLKNHGCPLIW